VQTPEEVHVHLAWLLDLLQRAGSSIGRRMKVHSWVRLPAWFHARERVTAFAKIRASLLNVSSWPFSDLRAERERFDRRPSQIDPDWPLRLARTDTQSRSTRRTGLLDHLVRAQQQRLRDGEAERFR
jgi:hypothetical protein